MNTHTLAILQYKDMRTPRMTSRRAILSFGTRMHVFISYFTNDLNNNATKEFNDWGWPYLFPHNRHYSGHFSKECWN